MIFYGQNSLSRRIYENGGRKNEALKPLQKKIVLTYTNIV